MPPHEHHIDWGAHQRRKPTIKRPRRNPMTSGPREQPTQRKGRSVGPVGWSADRPMGPTAFRLHVFVPYWSLMSVQGGICPFPGRGEGGSPYIYEGRGSILNHGGDGRSPSSLQATLEIPSRCSSSSLVEVLGLEEFRYES